MYLNQYFVSLSLVLTVVFTLKFYFEIKLRTFWWSHGIKSVSLNLGSVVKMCSRFKNFANTCKDLYNEYKSKTEDIVGINFVGTPIAIVTSPKLAQQMLDKDAHYFVGRGFYTNSDPITTNIFTIEEDRLVYPNLRDKLVLAFNAVEHDKIHDHMAMYAAIFLVPYLEPDAKFHRNIDVKDLMDRYVTRLVGYQLLEFNCCPVLNPETEIRNIALLLNTKEYRIKKLLSYLFPQIFDKYDIKTIDPSVGEFLLWKLRNIINFRARFYTGGKFFDELFIKPIKQPSYRVQNEEAVACCVQFLETRNTMAATMSYLLYELALNQDIQDELREEISTIYYRDNFRFRYDSIDEMPYLDRVVSETLRKYPPLATLHRVAKNSYQLPNGAIIPKGVRIIIPTLGFHHDPEYFPNPDKFDPERFAEKPQPFTYLPFGEGYNRCKGAKLALHHIKIGIAYLVRSYRFDICDKTEIPIKCDPINLWNVPKTGVWLNISNAR